MRLWIISAALLSLAIAAPIQAKPRKRIPNMPRGWSWPPNPAMIDAGKRCREDLEKLEVEVEAGQGKKVATPVVLHDMKVGDLRLEPTWRKGPFVMDCHLARGLRELAPGLRELGVASLRFSTIHEHRYVRRNGRRTNILSRHAIGLAIDVFEVGLDDGTVLVVERDYEGNATLAAIERLFADSEAFRNPLTPGVDPKGHDDHFHLEARMPLTAPRG